MTSASSSTEKTDASSSSPSPTIPLSNRDLTGAEILDQTRSLTSHNIHYAADTDIATHCEFIFNKDLKGDILVAKGSHAPLSEFLLSGIFHVDARNFFLTSDAKWNPNNPLGTRLDQAKATCNLLPVDRNPEFTFSAQHFPNIIGNLRAIENLANQRRSRDIASIIGNDSCSIKIIHKLFVVSFFDDSLNSLTKKKFKKKEKNDDPDDNINLQIGDYTIDNWPINPSNIDYLDAIKSSHEVRPIPAYDVKGNLITPTEYEEKIAGATARVCFAIVHFLIRQKHVYNVVVRDITIMRPPTTIATTTLKNVLHPKKND